MKYLGKITDNKDLVTKEYVDNADAARAPAGLGIAGASVGDLIKITAVDANGSPTAWAKAVAGVDYQPPVGLSIVNGAVCITYTTA